MPTPQARWRKALVVVALASTIPFLFSMLGTLLAGPLRGVGRHLAAHDDLGAADLIYVLNGKFAVRSQHAADLYMQGLAPRIVIAGTPPMDLPRLRNGPTGAEALAQKILQLGVPEDAVELLPEQVGSTIEEARALRRYLMAHPARKVIVATTDYHAGRAGWVLRRELAGLPVELAIAGAPDDTGVNPDNWWKTPIGRRTYWLESLKWLASTAVLTVESAVGRR